MILQLAKGLSLDKLLTEMEEIVESGTRLNQSYYIRNDRSRRTKDIHDFFKETENLFI